MKVLIIHGIGGHTGIHWQQWLHDELVKQGHTIIMLTLPAADHPDRQIWLSEIVRIVGDTKLSELIIVGHSLGVTTAFDFIEQASSPIKALVSVSGLVSDYGAELNSYFLRQKSINFSKVRQNLSQSFVLFGDNDPYVPQKALNEVAIQLNVRPTIIPDGGHLNTEAGFTTFPKLLEVIESIK
jgi:predicted alpha/beta hydrolase family esterase